MASTDRFQRREDIDPISRDLSREGSNESDESSEQASGVKRGGNNHFGSTGILKCLTCRKRKGKCEYNDLNEACRFCSDRSLQCGTKLSAKGARAHELSQQLLSLQREAGLVPFSDVSKLSSIAEALERRFPTASVGQIYAMAKPTVESAIAVAAEHARNDRTSPSLKSSLIPAASILFGQPLLGDTTPNSIRAQTPAARHAPAQPDVPFRTPSTHPSQPPPRSITIPQTQLQPQQVQFRPRRQTEQTSSYDIDSWFNTFPPANLQTPQPLPSTSTDFFSSQPEVQQPVPPQNYAQSFYSGLQPRPRFRHQHPPVHTDEGDIDYSTLFQNQQQQQ